MWIFQRCYFFLQQNQTSIKKYKKKDPKKIKINKKRKINLFIINSKKKMW